MSAKCLTYNNEEQNVGNLTAKEIRHLERCAAKLRLDIVEMIGVGAARHFGRSCSKRRSRKRTFEMGIAE